MSQVNTHPQVSIIIPTYNRAGTIVKSLESVRNQSIRSWECIVVDDGSTDNTKEIVQRFIDTDSRFLYLVRGSDRKKGANACRNIGIENAVGKYITFLDSDDEYLPFHLEQRLGHLESTAADGSYGAAYSFNGKERRKTTIREKGKDESWFNFVLENFVGTPFLFVKAEIARETKFDEGLRRHQDWDFLMRLSPEVVMSVYSEPTFVINYITHERRDIHFESCMEVYERHKASLVYKDSVKRYLFNMYEKAVNYNAGVRIEQYYRKELAAHFDQYTTSERCKLLFPSLYRQMRRLYLGVLAVTNRIH